MKRNLLLLITLISILFVTSCDRFTHNFQPPVTVNLETELFSPLEDILNSQSENMIDNVMQFYAEDYLYYGLQKEDIRNWLQSIYSVAPEAQAQVTLISSEMLSETTALADWRLLITTDRESTVLVDSLFLSEHIVQREGKWLLRGNQLSGSYPSTKEHIIIEYFTFLTCPNCPVVENKLNKWQDAYPQRISYLEHHISDQLAIPGDEVYQYYGYPPFPSSIIQGEMALMGNSPAILAEYDTAIQSLLEKDADILYLYPVIRINDKQVTGSITLELLNPELDLTNLYLNYALIDKVSPFQNTNYDYVRNVVLAQGSKTLTSSDLEGPISFSLTSSITIPNDAAIVIFAQTKPPVFENNAKIHSGIEIALYHIIKSKK